MNEMHELIDLPTVERIIRLLAVALPACGVAAGLIVGALRRRPLPGALSGLALGLAGPLIWLLWLAYGRITGHYGLDSVKGLLVNLALFVAVGAAVGILLAWARRRWPGRQARNTS